MMTSTKKLLAVGVFASVAALFASGCSTETGDENEEAPAGESQDELAMRKGSVDHAAIVEVTTMMLVGEIGTQFATVLDPYNQADPFAIRGASYTPTFQNRLAQFDQIDGHVDWKPEQAAAWITRITEGNYLVVDTSKPCDFNNPHTYLEIERAQLTGRAHTTCGGRMPNEDALDVTANFLIRGPSASDQDEGAITDGVDQATKQATSTFPYLGEMNGF